MASAEVETPAPPSQPGLPQQDRGRCAGICCCSFLFLLVVAYFSVVPLGAGDLAVRSFLGIDDTLRRETGDGYDITNLTYKVSWPLCGPYEGGEPMSRFENGCGGECYDARALPREVEASLADSGGQVVRYPSRVEAGVESIQLGGLLIPAGGNSSGSSMAPRIVVAHGFSSNSNSFYMLVVARTLRELGYHVLLSNFRDYGYSGASQNRIKEWGGAYTYDLLGAWDYLVNDADGLMGGRISDDKVGLVGVSMGAFMTLNAFGLESRVPAAWADSPPYRPKHVFLSGAKELIGGAVGSFGVWLIGDRLWAAIVEHAESKGVDLERNTPEKNLPRGPSNRRPLALTTNPADAVVPFSEYQSVRALLRDHPDKYLVEDLVTDKSCGVGLGSSHCVSLFVESAWYAEKLCTFFRTAFQEDASSCSGAAAAARRGELFVL